MTYSNITTPPVSTLCRADGKEIRMLEDNKAYAARALGRLAPKEFFTMRADDGSELSGYIVKPADFNASKRYPVIMSQYSGRARSRCSTAGASTGSRISPRKAM